NYTTPSSRPCCKCSLPYDVRSMAFDFESVDNGLLVIKVESNHGLKPLCVTRCINSLLFVPGICCHCRKLAASVDRYILYLFVCLVMRARPCGGQPRNLPTPKRRATDNEMTP